MEEKMKKLGEVMEANEGFAEELYGQETAEEAQALLKEKGLEFTLEEINQVHEALVKMTEAQASGKELSEDDLEEVAGGIVHPTVTGKYAPTVAPSIQHPPTPGNQHTFQKPGLNW